MAAQHHAHHGLRSMNNEEGALSRKERKISVHEGLVEGAEDLLKGARRASSRLYRKMTTPFVDISKYDQAAWMLDLAMRGRYVVPAPGRTLSESLPHETEAINTYSEYLFATKLYYYAVSVSLLLTVFETPLWCNGEGHVWVNANPKEVCKIPDSMNQAALLSGLPLIPTGYGIIIEIICFAVIAMKVRLEYKLESFFTEIGTYYRDPRRRYEAIVLVSVGVADVLYFCAFLNSNFRLAPYVRFGLGATVPGIRRVLKTFSGSAYAIKEVTLFLAGTIVLFAWVGALLFCRSEAQDAYGNTVADDFFPFGVSLYSSFLAVTTTNLPDVMVASLSLSRVYLLMWWPLLFIGAIIFMNVILAVVYNDYSDSIQEKQKLFVERNKKGVDGCFSLCSEDLTTKTGEKLKGITYEGFEKLTKSLIKLHINVDMTLVQFVFQGLDDDGNGYLTKSEFYDMCDVLQYKFTLTKRDSPLQEIEAFRIFKKICDNGKRASANGKTAELGYQETFPESQFDKIMNVVLGINVIFIAIESYYDLSNKEEPPIFSVLDFGFSFVYLMEVGIKLSVWSWSEYWSTGDNRFDFITTLLLALAGVMILSGVVDALNLPSNEFLMLLNILRLVRVLKALSVVDSLRRELLTIKKMTEACFDVLLINGLVIYIWAAAGLQMFGGKLYSKNKMYKDGDASDLDYYDQHMQVFSFNDVPLGCVTLFFMALTSWIPEVGEALIELTDTDNPWYKVAVWFYLLSFFAASPLIAFNVFSAFSIDAYLSVAESISNEEELREQGKAGKEGSIAANLHKIECKLASEQGKCLHIKASAQMTANQVMRAMFDGDDDDDDGGEGDDKKEDSDETERKLPEYGIMGDKDED